MIAFSAKSNATPQEFLIADMRGSHHRDGSVACNPQQYISKMSYLVVPPNWVKGCLISRWSKIEGCNISKFLRRNQRECETESNGSLAAYIDPYERLKLTLLMGI
jgi:hypothetical protein